MSESNTFISIIIPTCNRNETLKKCLDRLIPEIQNIEEDSYEIIVTDDSNDDVSKDLIESVYTWVKWIRGPKKGPSANRNNGAMYAHGEWFIFLDDDVIPDTKLITQYINAIKENEHSAAFEGAIDPDDEVLLKKDMAECPVNTDGGHFWSANICVKAEIFEKVGGFDERYVLAAQEDQQIKIDIESLTHAKIIFLKSCRVIHPVRIGSVKKQIQMLPKVSKNFALFAVKNRFFLGYDSVSRFFLHQLREQVSVTLKFIRQMKIKKSFVAIVYCCFSIPLNVYNFYSILKKSGITSVRRQSSNIK